MKVTLKSARRLAFNRRKFNTDLDSEIEYGKKAEIYAGKFLKSLVECAASLGD